MKEENFVLFSAVLLLLEMMPDLSKNSEFVGRKVKNLLRAHFLPDIDLNAFTL